MSFRANVIYSFNFDEAILLRSDTFIIPPHTIDGFSIEHPGLVNFRFAEGHMKGVNKKSTDTCLK